MDLIFEDTVAPETNRGRKAEDNPFETPVAEIALKKNDKGQPRAKTVKIAVPKPENGESQKDVTVKFINSLITKLKNAGLKVEPKPVTVYRQIETISDPKNGDTLVVTFWTGEKIVREVKKKDETAPAEAVEG